MVKRLVLKNTIFILLLISVQTTYAQYKEYEIKAQYINLFTQYIEWPENSDVNDTLKSFRIKIIGENPFGNTLEDLTKSIKIKGKDVVFEEVNLDNLSSCDILFISNSQKGNLQKIIDRTKGKGVILVSDSEGFASKGVFINFYIDRNRIRFEINKKAVEDEGFMISSRLLKLAYIVE